MMVAIMTMTATMQRREGRTVENKIGNRSLKSLEKVTKKHGGEKEVWKRSLESRGEEVGKKTVGEKKSGK